MPLMIPGAESAESLVRFDCSSDLASGSATVIAGVFNLIPRGNWPNSGSVRLAGSNDSPNNGAKVETTGVGGGTRIFLSVRFTTGAHRATELPAAVDSLTGLAFHADMANNTLTFLRNGEIDSTVALEEGSSWFGGILQPFVQSTSAPGKDTEWYEIAFWHNGNDPAPENVGLYVPTVEDLQDLTANLGIIGTVVEPKSYIAPAGTDGVIATSFPDLAPGGRTWTQTSGATSGDFAPYFVGPPTEVDVDVDATARTLNIEGTTSASGGTVYVIVDTAANMPTPPNPEDVVGGFLADGVTAALDFASQAMTGITNFSVALKPLPANASLAYALVHDKDDAGDYTAVIYGTISTKRPVIVPATTDKRLLDAGEPVISETGMTMWVLGTEYSQAGYATDSAGLFELDLTEYLNTTGTEDIGDTVDIVLTLADGERGIVAMGQTITEGD